MAHIRSAFDTAHVGQDLVILLGVEPESPETEYGWIEPAESIREHGRLRRVRRFWENPVPAWLRFCSYAAVCGTVSS